MRVAVTGANGFVGRHACRALRDAGHTVTAVIRRREITELDGAAKVVHVDNAKQEANWREVLGDNEMVLHLMSSPEAVSPDSKSGHQSVMQGTLALARAAAAQSVKRFVFTSTIKVNGEATTTTPFRPDTEPQPISTYGKMKLQTEIGLQSITKELGLPVTIVRPSAVYGPGGHGNIQLLVKLMMRMPGWSLPFAGIENRRAVIYVGNLASALVRCVEETGDARRLFLLHDGEKVTTSQLCQLILTGLNKSPRLAPDPFGLIQAMASVTAPGIARRLYGSLDIADDGITEALGWTPPFSTAEGIDHTVAAFLDSR
ncbi:MAG: NAD-dependent epimerase/dehydratase family protein [Proteobacteria bacterium]|nr:NAD-dependent epimerase/dehydratase family protein [Pseudomonadota bacterium]